MDSPIQTFPGRTGSSKPRGLPYLPLSTCTLNAGVQGSGICKTQSMKTKSHGAPRGGEKRGAMSTHCRPLSLLWAPLKPCSWDESDSYWSVAGSSSPPHIPERETEAWQKGREDRDVAQSPSACQVLNTKLNTLRSWGVDPGERIHRG